jgi:multiple sugar transport system permease protein
VLREQLAEGLARIEAAVGMKFGDTHKPLLVSVRSGARVSMPGMMDTVLNLGLNDATVDGLAVASGVPQHLVAIPLAVFIHNRFKRLRNAAIGAYFLPYITSTVAIAILFSSLFSTDYGIVNNTLRSVFGSTNIDWLGDPDHIKPAIAMVVFWRYVGFNVVLYLAALQTIPKDLYEAATMDGASGVQQFFHITLPSLKPMIFFGVTLSVIGGLQLFEEPFILTGGRGGSDQAGMTTAIYLYRMAFDFNDFGAASAMSWLLFLVVAVLTWLTNRAFRPRPRKTPDPA